MRAIRAETYLELLGEVAVYRPFLHFRCNGEGFRSKGMSDSVGPVEYLSIHDPGDSIYLYSLLERRAALGSVSAFIDQASKLQLTSMELVQSISR